MRTDVEFIMIRAVQRIDSQGGSINQHLGGSGAVCNYTVYHI